MLWPDMECIAKMATGDFVGEKGIYTRLKTQFVKVFTNTILKRSLIQIVIVVCHLNKIYLFEKRCFSSSLGPYNLGGGDGKEKKRIPIVRYDLSKSNRSVVNVYQS